MGKPRFANMFTIVLNRGLTWIFHEILTEAIVVLWIGCHLSMKFGTRFFPEWGITRIDPDKYTSLDLLLRLLLRQNINGCVWDGLVSSWKPQTVLDTAVASTARGNAGYIGAFAAVAVTVMLGVSVVCFAWANRRWRIPRWTQHLRNCRRITTWFRYSTTYDGDEWEQDPNAPEVAF